MCKHAALQLHKPAIDPSSGVLAFCEANDTVDMARCMVGLGVEHRSEVLDELVRIQLGGFVLYLYKTGSTLIDDGTVG